MEAPYPIPSHQYRADMERLQDAIGAMAQLHLEPHHHFARGVYARELSIPAGSCIVGKIHKHSQINVLLKGQMRVTTDSGIEDVSAPRIIVSPPGTQRAAYTHTDCTWLTISGTFETDLQKLESELVVTSYEEYERFCAQTLQLNGGA